MSLEEWVKHRWENWESPEDIWATDDIVTGSRAPLWGACVPWCWCLTAWGRDSELEVRPLRKEPCPALRGQKRLALGAHKELDVSQPLLLRQRATAKVNLKWNSKKTKGTSPSSRRAVPLQLQETSCRGRRYQGTSGRDKHSPTEGQEGAER